MLLGHLSWSCQQNMQVKDEFLDLLAYLT
jgi:hypothetical protein